MLLKLITRKLSKAIFFQKKVFLYFFSPFLSISLPQTLFFFTEKKKKSMWYLPQQHRLRASSSMIIITFSAFMITMTTTIMMVMMSNNNAYSVVAAPTTTVATATTKPLSPQSECESVDGGVFDPYSGACLTTIPRASLLAPCDEATSLAKCGCTTCALPGCTACITTKCGSSGAGGSGGSSSPCPGSSQSCAVGWSTQFGQFPCKSLDSAGIEGADKQAAIDASMLGNGGNNKNKNNNNNNFMNDVYASSGVLFPVIPTTAVQVNSPEYFRQKSVNDEQYFGIFGNSNNNNNGSSTQTTEIVQIVVNWVPPVSLSLFGFFAVYYLISRA